jgi:hypothetical protein
MMQSHKPVQPATLCVLGTLAILLPSCTTTNSGGRSDPVRVACQAFAPIYWHANDTPGTVAQVKEHNAAWVRLCREKESSK